MINKHKNLPLGKQTQYSSLYAPEILFPIPRSQSREALGLTPTLPFSGSDTWTAYEVSWLNKCGKPIVAIADFIFPCCTPNIIESKSFKLYLNSFNQTQFSSEEEVLKILEQDLSNAAGEEIDVKLKLPNEFSQQPMHELSGTYIDNLDINIIDYSPNPRLLKTENETIDETLVSHLLKSNCPVTEQPDWGTLQIHYVGKKINHESLLKYIISYREHNSFHEYCVEKIFLDIMEHCAPEKLSVYARYTRRGGLDINPFRSNFEKPPENIRTVRQ